MRLGILTAVMLPLLAAGACVPDFTFGGGTGGTSSTGDGQGGDGDGGRRRPDGDGGDGGGRRPTTVGGLSTTDAGPGSSTASGSGSVTTVSVSSGGDGGTGTPSSSSSGASTSSGGTSGVPCWDGDDEQVVTCSGGESACCADTQFYSYDECGPLGGCGEFAWELGCNESADCGSQLCCVTTDGEGALASIGCSASCSDFEACDPSEGCSDGSTCTPIPQLDDELHPEYGAYGYCH